MRKIDAHELDRMRKEDASLPVVNVLDPEKFELEHIPGSVNVPATEPNFPNVVEKKAGGRNRPVVVYGRSRGSDASPNAAEQLEMAGFAEVYEFEGGIEEWKRADKPVESA